MPFTIEQLPNSKVLRARMSHLFTSKDASGLMRAYSDFLTISGSKAANFDLLVDVSDAPIQPAEIVQILSDFLRRPNYRPARIVFVHGGNAIKMQAKRVSGDLGGRHFDTAEQALSWLFGNVDEKTK